MAITDIKAYAHLTDEDIDALAAELDAIRAEVEESRGERDARYIRRTIQLQRALAAGGRIALFASSSRLARIAGILSMEAPSVVDLGRSLGLSCAEHCGFRFDNIGQWHRPAGRVRRDARRGFAPGCSWPRGGVRRQTRMSSAHPQAGRLGL